MIDLKTAREIKLMEDGGKKLREVAETLLSHIKPGMTTMEIDSEAEELIKRQGGESSFKSVKGFRWTTCLPINEQVVHTPPSDRVLKEGDVLTVDIGMYYRGFHTDYAETIVVGGVQKDTVKRFLTIGKDTLVEAIKQAKAGNHVGNISAVIEHKIRGAGYFILKELTGHGIGRKLHEDPFVFGYLDKPIEKTPIIKPGLVIAIEIIYSMGSEAIVYEEGSDWSIRTADSSLSACFEQTVAVTNKNTLILT